MNKFKNQKCVIMCGGSSSRLFPHSKEKQKSMLKINKKTILQYVIEYWQQFTNDFIFVVKHFKEDVMKFVKTLPIKSEFVEPFQLKGIANGLSYTENLIGENFIMVLGDCLCKGNFKFPSKLQQGVGIWETTDENAIKQSYAVKIKSNKIIQTIEKPKELLNNYCGMGFYFFNKKIFKYISSTSPSKLRNEIEITDVIQNMITAGEKILPLFFKGDYLNINTYTDFLKAKKIFK